MLHKKSICARKRIPSYAKATEDTQIINENSRLACRSLPSLKTRISEGWESFQGKYSIKTIFSQCIAHKNVYGFLLIEIMVAFALLSCVSIIMAHFCFTIAQWQHESKMFAQAVNIAQTMLETCRRDKVLPATTSKKDSFLISCRSFGVPKVTLPFFYTADFLDDFSFVEIKVEWRALNRAQKIYTVTTGLELNSTSARKRTQIITEARLARHSLPSRKTRISEGWESLTESFQGTR